MSNLAKTLLALAVLAVGYMVYKRLKKKPMPTPGPTTNGPQMGDGNLPSDGSDPTFTPCSPVGMDHGCSGNYQDTCGSINWGNPTVNLGCCGEVVYNLQCGLNQLQAFGLLQDGKYGPNTQQALMTVKSQQTCPPDIPGVSFQVPTNLDCED